MLGNRNAMTVLNALFSRQHYIALINMCRNYPRFTDNLQRYLTGCGEYPYAVEVRTPVGIAHPTLYTHHDLLVVNEIFCRLDYYADPNLKVVVDLGPDIGISALYFLTRNLTSHCYLFEPDPRNLSKLRKNLSKYESRFELNEMAVSDKAGRVKSGIEPSGRNGGMGASTHGHIEVECLNINHVLDRVLSTENTIDILKVDSEGVEIKTVLAIKELHLRRIKRIYMKARPDHHVHPEIFDRRQYGSVCQLTNRSLAQSL